MNRQQHGSPRVLKRFLCRSALLWVQNINTRQYMDREEPDESEYCKSYSVQEMLNRPYMNRDEVPLAMDIFKPEVTKGTELPVIVVIHGGGLVVGDRKISRRYAKALASRGYLVFSIEYRLAPRANSAEQLDAVCAGLDLVGRELVNFDLDFSRMTIHKAKDLEFDTVFLFSGNTSDSIYSGNQCKIRRSGDRSVVDVKLSLNHMYH